MGKLELPDSRPTTPFQWVWLFLKYASMIAGIIYAGSYGAGQADDVLEKLKVSYREQSYQITKLQEFVEHQEEEKKATVTACKNHVDGMRSNMMFFLMGERKARENGGLRRLSSTQQKQEQRQQNKTMEVLLGKVAKNVRIQAKSASAIKRRPVLKRPKAWKKIEQIQQQAQAEE
jgi:hypothetical protein